MVSARGPSNRHRSACLRPRFATVRGWHCSGECTQAAWCSGSLSDPAGPESPDAGTGLWSLRSVTERSSAGPGLRPGGYREACGCGFAEDLADPSGGVGPPRANSNRTHLSTWLGSAGPLATSSSRNPASCPANGAPAEVPGQVHRIHQATPAQLRSQRQEGHPRSASRKAPAYAPGQTDRGACPLKPLAETF